MRYSALIITLILLGVMLYAVADTGQYAMEERDTLPEDRGNYTYKVRVGQAEVRFLTHEAREQFLAGQRDWSDEPEKEAENG